VFIGSPCNHIFFTGGEVKVDIITRRVVVSVALEQWSRQMKYHIDADVSIDQNDPERFVVRECTPAGWRDLFGPATYQECKEEIEDILDEPEHDPENIYGLASIRQSIEEDRR